MNTTLISRIASQIPDTVNIKDKNAVFDAMIAIDKSTYLASDEFIKAVIERVRCLRAIEKVALTLSIPAIVFVLWFFAVVLAPEHAIAATAAAAVPASGEYFKLIGGLIIFTIVSAFVLKAVLNAAMPVKIERKEDL
jgi:hypothetical protein